MREQTIVFFDLETGGLEESRPVIQLAALAVRLPDFGELATFERKLRFDPATCDPAALELNSYDAETWAREAVPEAQAVRDFADWLAPHRCVEVVSKRTGRPYRVARIGGHNVAAFDVDRLLAMFRRHDAFCAVDLSAPLDTRLGAVWHFARTGETPPESFRLSTLAEHFGAKTEGAHDALVDCRLSAHVARALLGGCGLASAAAGGLQARLPMN